jgi:hypothetical protein
VLLLLPLLGQVCSLTRAHAAHAFDQGLCICDGNHVGQDLRAVHLAQQAACCLCLLLLLLMWLLLLLPLRPDHADRACCKALLACSSMHRSRVRASSWSSCCCRLQLED